MKKDVKTFGINFKTYITAVMVVSFLAMLHAILKYHNRNRENLRPKSSIGTCLLMFIWILLILTKLGVYIIGFQNTPGLFFVPMFFTLSVSYFILSIMEPQFKTLHPHNKMVYILISFLVPVSLPSRETKSMLNLYTVSLLLFPLECCSILCYASMMKNFYHFEEFRVFFSQFPHFIQPVMPFIQTFDQLIILIVIWVICVTVLSSIFLVLYSKFHPSNQLFRPGTPWLGMASMPWPGRKNLPCPGGNNLTWPGQATPPRAVHGQAETSNSPNPSLD